MERRRDTRRGLEPTLRLLTMALAFASAACQPGGSVAGVPRPPSNPIGPMVGQTGNRNQGVFGANGTQTQDRKPDASKKEEANGVGDATKGGRDDGVPNADSTPPLPTRNPQREPPPTPERKPEAEPDDTRMAAYEAALERLHEAHQELEAVKQANGSAAATQMPGSDAARAKIQKAEEEYEAARRALNEAAAAAGVAWT